MIGENDLGMSTQDGITYKIKKIDPVREITLKNNQIVSYNNKIQSEENKKCEIDFREGGYIDEEIKNVTKNNRLKRGLDNYGNLKACNSNYQVIESRTKKGNLNWRKEDNDTFELGLLRDNRIGAAIEGQFMNLTGLFSHTNSKVMVIYQKEKGGTIKMKIANSSHTNESELVLGDDNKITLEKR